jgi:hypothetical protein
VAKKRESMLCYGRRLFDNVVDVDVVVVVVLASAAKRMMNPARVFDIYPFL